MINRRDNDDEEEEEEEVENDSVDQYDKNDVLPFLGQIEFWSIKVKLNFIFFLERLATELQENCLDVQVLWLNWE